MSISSGGKSGRRGSAGNDGLQLLAVGNAAADLVDHLLEVVAHGQFVDAGAFDVAAEAEEARAAVAFGAEFGVVRGADAEDVRNGGDGLGVVDDGGPAVESDDRGEGRADARDAALAFQRFHQRGFFADFVRAGAGLGDDVEVDAGAEDVLAEEALGVGLGDGALHDL